MRRIAGLLAALALAGLLAACEDSKEDILSKSRDISSKTQLVDVLGEPDDIAKVGPIETWT